MCLPIEWPRKYKLRGVQSFAIWYDAQIAYATVTSTITATITTKGTVTAAAMNTTATDASTTIITTVS